MLSPPPYKFCTTVKGLVKEQELEIQRRPFLPAHLPTLTYYSLLICYSEWPFSYSGYSRKEKGSAIPHWGVNCEREQRIQRCSHPCISSWGCPRWRPHWSCWAAPCHPRRCVWHCGSASGTGSAPGSPETKNTHNVQLLGHWKRQNEIMHRVWHHGCADPLLLFNTLITFVTTPLRQSNESGTRPLSLK